MPRKKNAKESPKKPKKLYCVKTRPNLGMHSQFERVASLSTLSIVKTFAKYLAAVDFIKTFGDTKNVYFINDNTEKWSWNKKKLWHITSERQLINRDTNRIADLYLDGIRVYKCFNQSGHLVSLIDGQKFKVKN